MFLAVFSCQNRQKISFFNAISIEFSKMADGAEVLSKGNAISVGNLSDFDENSDENSDQIDRKCVLMSS